MGARVPRGRRRWAGYDPYSARKAAAELVTACLPALVLRAGRRRARRDRARRQRHRRGRLGRGPLVPDCVRALSAGEPIVVRNPEPSARGSTCSSRCPATCCWRSGCWEDGGDAFAEGWNFGPAEDGGVHGARRRRRLMAAWGAGSWESPARPSSRTRRTCCSSTATRPRAAGLAPQWDVDDRPSSEPRRGTARGTPDAGLCATAGSR